MSWPGPGSAPGSSQIRAAEAAGQHAFFRCLPPSTVNETPANPEKSGGFVDVDTVDGTQINKTLDEAVDIEDPDEEVEWAA